MINLYVGKCDCPFDEFTITYILRTHFSWKGTRYWDTTFHGTQSGTKKVN